MILTQKQADLMALVMRDGVRLTFRGIADAMGMTVGGAYGHANAVHIKGGLTWCAGMNRTIRPMITGTFSRVEVTDIGIEIKEPTPITAWIVKRGTWKK